MVQGLTEFLPVSSTAHLILAPQFLGVEAPAHPHTYDTVIQAGTLAPVILFFWRDWRRIAGAGWAALRRGRVGEDAYERLALHLLIGTAPALVAGALLHSQVEQLGDPAASPIAYLVIGVSLMLVALVMIAAEKLRLPRREEQDLRWSHALMVGVAQAVAVIPGISRSGATITAGMFAGLSRAAAARFSFLLMMPVMVAATAFSLWKMVGAAEPVQAAEWQSLGLATLVSAVVGYAAIAFLLRFLQRNSLYWFVGYRLAVGGFLIAFYFMSVS